MNKQQKTTLFILLGIALAAGVGGMLNTSLDGPVPFATPIALLLVVSLGVALPCYCIVIAKSIRKERGRIESWEDRIALGSVVLLGCFILFHFFWYIVLNCISLGYVPRFLLR